MLLTEKADFVMLGHTANVTLLFFSLSSIWFLHGDVGLSHRNKRKNKQKDMKSKNRHSMKPALRYTDLPRKLDRYPSLFN